jgi:hypothetical protein
MPLLLLLNIKNILSCCIRYFISITKSLFSLKMKIFDCLENFPVLHFAMVLTVPSRSNFPSDFGKFRSHFSHEVVRLDSSSYLPSD